MSERSAAPTVLLVDDHAIVRDGLRMLLLTHSSFRVIGEAGSLTEALALDCDPDVVIADLVLGDARGAAIVSGLRGRFPRASVLCLTMIDAVEDVREALAAGALGYLLKEAAAAELVDALDRVAGGNAYVQPSLGAELARRGSSNPVESLVGRLTDRERDVLKLVAMGHTNAEIAHSLQVSLRTVETHRSHILDKLQVRTRAQLMKFAIDAGLVRLSSDRT